MVELTYSSRVPHGHTAPGRTVLSRLHCQVRRYSPWKALEVWEKHGVHMFNRRIPWTWWLTLHGSSTSQRDEIWWSDNLWRYMMMISGYMMILWWPHDDTWLHHADLWSWNLCVCVLYSKDSASCNQTNINQPSAGKDDLQMIDEDRGWHSIMYYL